MRGGIYARLEIKNAIERTYNLTQPHRGADRWLDPPRERWPRASTLEYQSKAGIPEERLVLTIGPVQPRRRAREKEKGRE